jgi:hypothetical protein
MVKLVAPTVSVTSEGGLLDAETLPKANVAALVPELASVTPLASLTNAMVMEPRRFAVTVRVPEAVCPCAEAKPGISHKPARNTMNQKATFFILEFSVEIIPADLGLIASRQVYVAVLALSIGRLDA